MSHPFEPHNGGVSENDRRYVTYDAMEQQMLEQSRALYDEQGEQVSPVDNAVPRTEAQWIAGHIAQIIVGQKGLPPLFPDNYSTDSEKHAAIATRVVAMRLPYQLPLSPERVRELTDALAREADAHNPAVQEGIRQASEGIRKLVQKG